MARMGGPMAADAVQRLAPMPGDEVIEIGFGPGVGLSTLSKAVPGGHVVGVDPSETMHRQATKRNADAIREGRISLVSGTVDALPFPDNSFDAGMAIDNLHFWPDPLSGLAQLQRVLKPGARFVCAFTPPSGDRHRTSSDSSVEPATRMSRPIMAIRDTSSRPASTDRGRPSRAADRRGRGSPAVSGSSSWSVHQSRKKRRSDSVCEQDSPR